MNEQMLEILISKYIDSEITPAEQKMLDAELQSNPEAQETLKTLEQLRDQSQQMIKEEVLLSGAPASTIIEQALAQSSRPRKQKGTPCRRWYRDPISLAACFILGLGFVSVWVNYGKPIQQTGSNNRQTTASPPIDQPWPPLFIKSSEERTPLRQEEKRNPDDGIYLYYTDPETGKVRAVELHRKSDIKTVTYDEGL